MFWIIASAGAVAAGALAAMDPTIAAALVAGALILSLIARSLDHASVALLLMAVPFMRPFLMGERYAVLSIALTLAAAGVALAADRRRTASMDTAIRALAIWLSVQWVWLLALPVIHPTMQLADLAKGIAQVPAALAAALIVLREPVRWRLAARWIVVATTVACGSYVVTLLCWIALGFGVGLIGPIPASYPEWAVNLYAPLTPTTSGGLFGGVYIPRFLGLGREPGVMAALIAWAVFTATHLGFRRRWVLLLLAGLLGTQSTAGFGVILMVWVITKWLIVPEWRLGTMEGFLRQVSGVVLLAAAAYLAIFAPTLGVEAKRQANPDSYDDRSSATATGLEALLSNPLGGAPEQITSTTQGINIIAATAIVGSIGTVITFITIIRPLTLARDARCAAPGVLTVIATVATAQPLMHSTGFYLLIGLSIQSTDSGSEMSCPLGGSRVGEKTQRGELREQRVEGGVAPS
jgi:hypothetical protein